jgi:hypothetical protein
MLLNEVISIDPKRKVTDEHVDSWQSEIDKMIRIDAREPQDMKDIINWLVTDDFWSHNILSGKTFREKFDTLRARYLLVCEKDKYLKHKNFAKKVKDQGDIKSMIIYPTNVIDKSIDLDLCYVMDYKEFCYALARKYGIEDFEGEI